jgi:hypothetical protein
LKQGNLHGETVGFMRAIQDTVIATKNYRKHILKEKLENDKCRNCEIQAEIIEHVISGCTAIANTDYLRRHDNVAKIIHQQLAEKYNLVNDHVPYYKYDPANVIDNNKVKIYWDREICTDVKINANRPDLILYNKEKSQVTITDVARPLTSNIQTHTPPRKVNTMN